MVDRAQSELIAPSRPRRALAFAVLAAVGIVGAWAVMLTSLGSVPWYLLFATGPVIGLSAWSVDTRRNAGVGLAAATVSIVAVPVGLYVIGRDALVRAFPAEKFGLVLDVSLWRDVTFSSIQPTWVPIVVWITTPPLAFVVGSGIWSRD